MGTRTLFCCCFMLAGLVLTEAIDRIYYIGAVEREWNYAPQGNIVSRDLDQHAETFIMNSTTRIGRRYKKVLYREFTDGTFTTEKAHPPHLGILGPVLRAEVGDRFVVTFRNLATRNYSMHPHGVQYEKGHEGAFYQDGTSGADKLDDWVVPGGQHTYLWNVGLEEAPEFDDPECLTWTYHSHIETERDTNSGLIGSLHTCKPGALSPDENDPFRVDVIHDYTLLFKVFDESLSWYIDDNIQTYLPGPIDKDDEDFKESNKKHGINGYLYGNVPGISMCSGETVSWHLFGIGHEIDMHAAVFHGQSLINNNHRRDYNVLFPGDFDTNLMEADTPGKWLLQCPVVDHYEGGMQAFFDVSDCYDIVTPPLTVFQREYFIAADEVDWNYFPMAAAKQTRTRCLSQVPRQAYRKALFRQYTDGSFTTLRPRPERERHMGFLGPVIRAEVGDNIRVHFRNNVNNQNFSIQARGVHYDKDNEGTYYLDGRTDQYGVAPGETRIYDWFVTEDYAPRPTDPDCLTYMYYSARHVTDIYAGLVGPLLVCKPGTLDGNSEQRRMDREFILLFTMTREYASPFFNYNVKTHCSDAARIKKNKKARQEYSTLPNINGFMFNTVPALDMCVNDLVSWHLLGVGSEHDLHPVKFHGNTYNLYQHHLDATLITPASTATVYMEPDNPGEWSIVCRTNSHLNRGMAAKYNVTACSSRKAKQQEAPKQQTRVMYIAAVEEAWNYAPSDVDPIWGTPLSDPNSRGAIFVVRGNTTIGREYRKALYREYTDATFTQRVTRGPEDVHLDVMGPFIKVEVGDQIQVHFRNMASRPYSMHPHMLLYNKENEGAEDDFWQDQGIGVQPGETRVYTWDVPARSGPGTNDPACITSLYYSHVDSSKDSNSGLVGPLVICRAGTLSPGTTRRVDVDREFALLFSVVDENDSHYLTENINTYCYRPELVDRNSPTFRRSNQMNAINGRIYGNNQGLVMTSGESVAWYLLGMGDEVDIHTVHFHGQTVTVNHDHTGRADVVDVFPGTSDVAHMDAQTPGNWLVHCHVNEHIDAGMETAFVVNPEPSDKKSDVGNPVPAATYVNTGAIIGAITGCLFIGSVVAFLIIRSRKPVG